MKLKKILKEQNDKKLAKKLDEKLQGEYLNTNRNLLFRSEQDLADAWNEKKIRKDRNPQDTAAFIDAIIMQLERDHYPEVPKRRKSKFAVTEEGKDQLSMYSGYTFVCFPHQSSNVYSIEEDAFTAYFQEAKSNFEKAVSKWYTSRNEYDFPDVIENFLQTFWDEWNGGRGEMYGETMEFVSNNWKRLRKTTKKLNKNYEDTKKTRILSNLYRGFRNIFLYFEEMEKGIVEGYEEIIFDGPSYIIIDETFFDTYIEWSEGSWGLKEKYKD